jgi:MIP family channel proteins
VYTLGGISGAHVNPAISASLFIQRKIGPRDFVMYVIFQVLGATIAAFIAANAYPRSWVSDVMDGATLGIMTAAPQSSLYNPGGALLLEVIMTFMLAMAVSTVVRAGDQFATASGLLIGGTLFVCILFGGPWTGASLNPARSMGPALAYNESVIWGTLWLYWIGPIIGGVLAGLTTKWLRGEKMSLAKDNPTPPST